MARGKVPGERRRRASPASSSREGGDVKDERVAVVTGATRGLGHTLADFLAKQQWTLVATARGQRELGESVQRLQASGATVHALAGDVADPDHRRKILTLARRIGGLDLLVNNASELGTSPLPPLARYPVATLRRVLEVNLVAALALTQDLLPLLRKRRGLVVNITSDAAQGGYPGWGAYGASKAALDLISKTLAAEFKEDGVGVVSVDPGDMRTKMHQDAYPGQDISDRPLPDVTLPFWAWLLSQSPMAVSGGRYQAQAAVWEVPA